MKVDRRISDPDAHAYLASLPEPAPRAGLSPGEIRARPRVPLRVDPDTYRVSAEDVLLPASVGGLGARVYRHRDRPVDATLLYLHGGGWALGDLDINDDVCRYLVDRTGVSLLSLDYPLAPEHPFPAALEAANRVAWAVSRGELFDLPSRLVYGGLSAGAALAASLAGRAGTGLAPAASALILLSPVCDSDLGRASYETFGDAPLLAAADMAWFWSLYDAAGVAREDPDAAPLRAASFAGLPPTTVVAAGVDPLVDEAVAYVAALARDGVDVSIDVVPGVMHAFMAVPSIRSGRLALDSIAARLTSALRARN